jgi:hypothetical protein
VRAIAVIKVTQGNGLGRYGGEVNIFALPEMQLPLFLYAAFSSFAIATEFRKFFLRWKYTARQGNQMFLRRHQFTHLQVSLPGTAQ